MKKYCINICTYKNHYEYVNNLIISLIKHDTSNLDIFLFFDNENDASEFKKLYYINYNNRKSIYLISLSEVLKNLNLRYQETNENIYENLKKKNVDWEGGRWVVIKRSYSILYLRELGYTYTLLLDSEGLIIKDINITNLINNYNSKSFLLVSETALKKSWKSINEYMLNTFLKLETLDEKTRKLLLDCAVRQNDFWIINTSYFNNFIDDILLHSKRPLSLILHRSEFWHYELWIYYKSLNGLVDIDIINFKNIFKDIFKDIKQVKTYDFHGKVGPAEFLLIAIKKNDLNTLDLLNNKYFNRCLTWRGNYYLKAKELN